jgi:ABC-type amino acid transport substrate-binding protein
MNILPSLLAVLLLTACTAEAERPPLRIASDATFAPFHLLDADGMPTGFDIELARAVAIEAGFEPEVVVLAYHELFSGLKARTHDVVAATTGITAERQQQYLFSDPYFETCQVAVVRTGADEPQNLADLRGTRIGAGGAGTSFKAMLGIDGEHVRLEDGEGQAALAERRIDAWMVDEFDGVAAARASQGSLRVLAEPVALERYGLVLPRDRTDLKVRLDKALQALRERGAVAALQARFGVERGADWPVAL